MSLALALGWKYGHAPGIETVGGVLTAWPDVLGPMPSEADLEQIVAEYEDFVSLPAPKLPTTIATAKLTVADGSIDGFTVDSAISGGFQIDLGKFWIFLSAPFEDADYIVNVFDGGLFRCYVQPDDYASDSFVITTTDLAGSPADPACISVIITKAI